MKFLTHRDGAKLPPSTYRVGSIQASIGQLLLAFGEPERFAPNTADGEFVSARWVLLFADGSYAEVYDFKRANEGSIDNVTWSIGGLSRTAVDNVHAAFRAKTAFPKTIEFPPIEEPFLIPALADAVESEGGHAD